MSVSGPALDARLWPRIGPALLRAMATVPGQTLLQLQTCAAIGLPLSQADGDTLTGSLRRWLLAHADLIWIDKDGGYHLRSPALSQQRDRAHLLRRAGVPLPHIARHLRICPATLAQILR